MISSSRRYCLPIITDSLERVLELIRSQKSNYHYFEVWLDYLRKPSAESIEKITNGAGKDRAIFLFRRQKLERTLMPADLRLELIKSLDRKKVLLDLDISSQEEEIAYLKSQRIKVASILSYHNYTFTPEDSELDTLVERMLKAKASICKVATLCRSEADALRLLALTLRMKKQGLRYIVLGMGEHGKVTRVVGTLWGNEMIFAPQSPSESSAPGQLTRKQLEAIFGAL